MAILFGGHDVSERVAAENEHAFAFPTNIPIVPGHILVCPRRAVERYEELSGAERDDMESLRLRVREALMRAFKAEGFNYAWNEGKVAGQSIAHLHLHVLPRAAGDAGVHEYEPRAFLYRPGSRAESPASELIEVAKLVRQNL